MRQRDTIRVMGYYIECPLNNGKAGQIADGKALIQVTGNPGNPIDRYNPATRWEQAPPYEANIIKAPPPSWEDIPPGKVLVVVINNDGIFDAAAVCVSKREYDELTRPGERRSRTYVLMDRDAAFQASGYTGEES